MATSRKMRTLKNPTRCGECEHKIQSKVGSWINDKCEHPERKGPDAGYLRWSQINTKVPGWCPLKLEEETDA